MPRALVLVIVLGASGCYLSHRATDGPSDGGGDSAVDAADSTTGPFDAATDARRADASPDTGLPDAGLPDECVLEVVADATLHHSRRSARSPRLVSLGDGEIGLITHDPGTGMVWFRRFTERLDILTAGRALGARSVGPASVASHQGMMCIGTQRSGMGQVRCFDGRGRPREVGAEFPAFSPLRLHSAGERLLWSGIRGERFGQLRVTPIGPSLGPDVGTTDIVATVNPSDLIAVPHPRTNGFILLYSHLTDASTVSAYAQQMPDHGPPAERVPLSPESDIAVYPVDLGGNLHFARHTPTGFFVDRVDDATFEQIGRTSFPEREVTPQVGTFDGRLVAASIEGRRLRIDNYGRSLVGPQTVWVNLVEEGPEIPETLELTDALIVAVYRSNGGQDAVRLVRLECVD